MRIPRLYLAEQAITIGNLTLGAEQSRYLIQVLRLRIGQALQVFDGQGNEYRAEVLSATRNNCGIKIIEHLRLETAPEPRIHLNLAISKGERMDFALQKSVELGVAVIRPLYSERSVVAMDPKRELKRTQRWRNIAISACEQSGRCHLPDVHAPQAIDHLLTQPCEGTTLLLHPDGARPLGDLAAPVGDIHLLIGPEGGLTAHEIKLALANGYQAIQLGPRVLRTETAPLAAIAAIQTLWGDFR